MNEEKKKTKEEIVFESSDESPLNPTADTIEEKKPEWLIDRRFPFGFVTLIIGESGCGKSQTIYDFTSHISKGENWPDGSPCPEGKVLLMNMVENDQNCITKPTLRVANAKMENITIEGIFEKTGQVFNLFEHEARIRSYFDQGGYRAWFIDALIDYTGGNVDFNNATKMRPVLNLLNRIAAKYHIAVIATIHFGKGLDRPAYLRYAGSHQIRAGVKVTYLMGIDPDDPELNPAQKRRFLMPDKNNLTGRWKKSWAFHVVEKEKDIGSLVWDEELEHIIDSNYVVSFPDLSAGVLDAIKFLLRCLSEAEDYSQYPSEVRRKGSDEGIVLRDINTAIKRLKSYVTVGNTSSFPAKPIWRLNFSNQKIYDLLEKYEIKLQKTTGKEIEAPDEAKEKVEKEEAVEKPKVEVDKKTPEEMAEAVKKIRADAEVSDN